MSAGLNTVAGTIYEDFIDPWMPESNKETKAANIMKVQSTEYILASPLFFEKQY